MLSSIPPSEWALLFIILLGSQGRGQRLITSPVLPPTSLTHCFTGTSRRAILRMKIGECPSHDFPPEKGHEVRAPLAAISYHPSDCDS